MKKTKKLLAMALALMMAFSCMAMPAMAHDDEDEAIMPLGPGFTCTTCGRLASYSGTEKSYREDESYRVGIAECPNISVAHTHLPYDIMEVYRCANCGQKYYHKIGESYDCIRDSMG